MSVLRWLGELVLGFALGCLLAWTVMHHYYGAWCLP
jgi:hypothetical protein